MLLVERTLEGRKSVMQMYLTAQSDDYTYNNLGPFLLEHCTGMWVGTFLNINALWHMF